jgi:hypothetical protein
MIQSIGESEHRMIANKPVELTACRSRFFVKGRAGSALIRAAAHFYVIRLRDSD